MGCTSSLSRTTLTCKDFFKDANLLKQRPKVHFAEDVKKSFPDGDIQVIMNTWKIMNKDPQGNGLQVFLRIFETSPDVKKLFRIENVRLTEIAHSVSIRGHGTRFMHAIGTAVDHLDDLNGTMSKVLFDLGQQHNNYAGFKPEFFEVFYEALMWQWAIALGPAFSTEVADAWSHLFMFIMERLQDGYYSYKRTKNGVV